MTPAADSPNLPAARPADILSSFQDWLATNAERLKPFRNDVACELAMALARARPLQQLLWDDGWTRLGWPEEYGGLGGPALQRFAMAEALSAAGYVVPEILGAMEIIAAMLAKYSPHLARRHIAAGFRGDEVWCQGFSEPNAGSDLGSLRTKAVAEGDGFRLSGQKAWSTNGPVSSFSCVLARTGGPDSGYRGLTMFWVDLSASGVNVVPTPLGHGRSETAEIFLDDVFVAAENVVGGVGQGWAVVMYLLQFERGAYAWLRQAEMHSSLRELIEDHADEFGSDGARVLGDAYLAVLGLRAQARGTLVELLGGHDLGPEISVDKVLLGAAEQAVTEAARRLLYPRLEVADPSDELAELWRQRWAFSRITTIYGGAAEVQRDLVAERLLGLPRGR